MRSIFFFFFFFGCLAKVNACEWSVDGKTFNPLRDENTRWIALSSTESEVLDFGSRGLSSSIPSQNKLKFKNLSLASVSIPNPTGSDFILIDAPVVVAANATSELTLEFRPTTAGEKQSTWGFSACGKSFSISLTGNGVDR